MSDKIKTILAIGGSDPCGGAGIQTDNRCILSLGLHPLNVITAVTSQNSKGVKLIEAVSAEMILSQLTSIFEDVVPDAIKLGMVGSIENGMIVSDFLKKKTNGIPLITDPVITASAGGMLIENDLLINSFKNFYIDKIFPISSVVTLNYPETCFYCGSNFKFEDFSNSPEILAGEVMENLSFQALVIKGGHSHANIITDVLAYKNNETLTFEKVNHQKIITNNLHGTGCAFASLLAGFLVISKDIKKAFLETCMFLENIISNSKEYSLGNSDYGPLNINEYLI